MTRLSPFALLMLPLYAGCCCCGGGFGGTSHVSPEELANATSLTVDGLGDVVATLGSEPYSIDTENALGSSSSIAGGDLTLSVGLGEATVSLPQLSKATIGETTGLDLRGVSASDLAIVKNGLGTVTASGTTTNLTIDADGMCSVELYDLTAENVTINLTGDGGSVDVTATGTLTVNITGNGYVNHKGGAEVTKNITGSGSVTNMDDDGGTTTDGDSVDAEEPDADGPVILDGEGFDGAAIDPVPADAGN